jgi:homoserine kinase
VSTDEARRALPAEVPLADATFNVGRASLLSLGLARQDLALIARGLADRIHQPRRARAPPSSAGRGGRTPVRSSSGCAPRSATGPT